eukprot:NODE_573_length_6556_cov_0.413040.p3 type:complete len:135 gc:universal NODE_573_length_6556_cov_0.413040:491-895(+)
MLPLKELKARPIYCSESGNIGIPPVIEFEDKSKVVNALGTAVPSMVPSRPQDGQLICFTRPPAHVTPVAVQQLEFISDITAGCLVFTCSPRARLMTFGQSTDKAKVVSIVAIIMIVFSANIALHLYWSLFIYAV